MAEQKKPRLAGEQPPMPLQQIIRWAAAVTIFSSALVGVQAVAAETGSPQWIVATVPAFRSAIGALVERRRGEGMAVTVIDAGDLAKNAGGLPDPLALKAEIERLRRQNKGPTYVLLVGISSTAAGDNRFVVPPLAGTIGRMKGEPSDHGYGLPDEKMMPAIAVGPLPARTVKEAAAMIEKTLAYDRERSSGEWRNRLTVLEGHPGGSTEFERRSAEAVVPLHIQGRCAKLRPEWTAGFVVHAASSPYFAANAELRQSSLDLVRQGQFWTIYLGHSGPTGLWSLGARYLDRQDWSELNIPRGAGLLFTCGCFACQTAGAEGEGYALAAIRNPGGPVAVVGAHGESYAAAGLLALDGLLAQLNSAKSPERLADYWLAIERGIVAGEIDPITFWTLDAADGSHGKVPLAEQRREHAEMWTLLGDPALRMPPRPLPIELTASGAVGAGRPLEISGVLPKNVEKANVRVAIERPLGSNPALPKAGETNQPQAGGRDRLRKANTFELDAQTVEPTDGRFHVALNVPAELPWTKVVIRATAEVGDQFAQGAVWLPVKR
jgi:hypothetical protein